MWTLLFRALTTVADFATTTFAGAVKRIPFINKLPAKIFKNRTIIGNAPIAITKAEVEQKQVEAFVENFIFGVNNVANPGWTKSEKALRRVLRTGFLAVTPFSTNLVTATMRYDIYIAGGIRMGALKQAGNLEYRVVDVHFAEEVVKSALKITAKDLDTYKAAFRQLPQKQLNDFERRLNFQKQLTGQMNASIPEINKLKSMFQGFRDINDALVNQKFGAERMKFRLEAPDRRTTFPKSPGSWIDTGQWKTEIIGDTGTATFQTQKQSSFDVFMTERNFIAMARSVSPGKILWDSAWWYKRVNKTRRKQKTFK